MTTLNVMYKLILHDSQINSYADIANIQPSLESNNMLNLLRCCKNIFASEDYAGWGYIVAYKTSMFIHRPVAVFVIGRTEDFNEKAVTEQWKRDYEQLFT